MLRKHSHASCLKPAPGHCDVEEAQVPGHIGFQAYKGVAELLHPPRAVERQS